MLQKALMSKWAFQGMEGTRDCVCPHVLFACLPRTTGLSQKPGSQPGYSDGAGTGLTVTVMKDGKDLEIVRSQ